MDTSQLIHEINVEYARTMNKIVFDQSLGRVKVNLPILSYRMPRTADVDLATCDSCRILARKLMKYCAWS